MADDFGLGALVGAFMGALVMTVILAGIESCSDANRVDARGPCAAMHVDDRCERVVDGEVETWACAWQEGSRVRVVRCEEVEPLTVPVRATVPVKAKPVETPQVIINNQNVQGSP